MARQNPGQPTLRWRRDKDPDGSTLFRQLLGGADELQSSTSASGFSRDEQAFRTGREPAVVRNDGCEQDETADQFIIEKSPDSLGKANLFHRLVNRPLRVGNAKPRNAGLLGIFRHQLADVRGLGELGEADVADFDLHGPFALQNGVMVFSGLGIKVTLGVRVVVPPLSARGIQAGVPYPVRYREREAEHQ